MRSLDKDQLFQFTSREFCQQFPWPRDAYGSAFATLTLSIRDGRLSIFNRKRPKVPMKE